MDPQVEQVVRLLLSRKLDRFREAIHAEVEHDSTWNKTERITVCTERLQTHCSRALRQYLSALELFETLSIPDGVVDTFAAHVDEAAADLSRALGTASQSDKNRIANCAAAVKARAETELREAIDIARKASSPTSTKADELDDRLPLGRRGAFDRDLARAVVDAEREKSSVALVMIDVDHFKKVNDDHGHPVGDEVLLEVAKLLVLRAFGKGTAYRFGGEEFALLLPRYSAEEAWGLAERMRKDLEDATVSRKELRITASFGAASVPAHASSATELLDQADAALYRAKRDGRNRVAVPA